MQPIPVERRFPRERLTGKPEHYGVPLSAWGFCERHAPAPEVPFYLGDYLGRFGYQATGRWYHARQMVDARRTAWIEVPPILNRNQTAGFRRARRALFQGSPRCGCGKPAAELNHLVPRYWARLSRVPAEALDIVENLVPMCEPCNDQWLAWRHYDESGVSSYWLSKRIRGWAEELDARRVAAHAALARAGTPVWEAPAMPLRWAPGQPVLRPPTTRGATTFELAAWFEPLWRWRTGGLIGMRIAGGLWRLQHWLHVAPFALLGKRPDPNEPPAEPPPRRPRRQRH